MTEAVNARDGASAASADASFGELISKAYGTFLAGLPAAIVPMAITGAVQVGIVYLAAQLATEKLNALGVAIFIGASLVSCLVAVPLLTGFQRKLLGGPGAAFALGRIEAAAFTTGLSLGILVTFGAIIGVHLTFAVHEVGIQIIVKWLLYLAMAAAFFYLAAFAVRAALVLPSVSAGRPITIERAWALTAGAPRRLTAAFLITNLPFIAAMLYLVWRLAEAVFAKANTEDVLTYGLAIPVVLLIATMVNAAFLSALHRKLVPADEGGPLSDVIVSLSYCFRRYIDLFGKAASFFILPLIIITMWDVVWRKVRKGMGDLFLVNHQNEVANVKSTLFGAVDPQRLEQALSGIEVKDVAGLKNLMGRLQTDDIAILFDYAKLNAVAEKAGLEITASEWLEKTSSVMDKIKFETVIDQTKFEAILAKSGIAATSVAEIFEKSNLDQLALQDAMEYRNFFENILFAIPGIDGYQVVRNWFEDVFFQILPFQSTLLQELEWHFHTLLFALVLGYGYVHNSHVRVDLIRENLHFRKKAWLEFLGSSLFMVPFCLVVIYFAIDYAVDSWKVDEISASLVGLPHRFIIKGMLVIGLAAAAMAGCAVWAQSAMVLFGPKDLRFELMTLEWPEEAAERKEQERLRKESQARGEEARRLREEADQKRKADARN